MYLIIFDLGMAITFYIIGLTFYKSNGKAANYITGYNMKNEAERKQFDEIHMCKIYGKRMKYWAIPFIIGAFVDNFINGVGCTIACIIWVVMFVYHMIDRTKREKSK